jgi:hypothetical protein
VSNVPRSFLGVTCVVCLMKAPIVYESAMLSTSFKRSLGCSVLADVIFLEFATTQYPVSRSRSAIPRPMPLDAPVTIATFVLTGESSPDDVARPSICCPKRHIALL